MVLLNLFFVSILLTFLFLLLNYFNEENYFKLNSSSFSVECGFQEIRSFPTSTSNQFFIIAVIFVVFDIELLILLPLPGTFMSIRVKLLVFVLLLLMTLGLIIE